MLSFDVTLHHTIVTTPDSRGRSITGVVMSKGPAKCSVTDTEGNNWKVPYALIMACSAEPAEIKILKAQVRDIVVDKNGEKFRVDKVNTSRYSVTRLRDQQTFYLPFTSVKEILDLQNSQREWLLSKGISEQDIAEFEKLFNN